MGCPTEQILTAVGCDGSAVGVLLAAGMLASLPGEGAGAGRWWKLWELLNVGVFFGKKGGQRPLLVSSGAVSIAGGFAAWAV